MRLRTGPLRAAAALAVAFVAARVVYRVLFHGADGDGPVLLPLPEVRLAPPFAHVVLLGPVTTDGVRDAAASALPIALTILAFGVLNALVDLPRLFTRASRRGPLSGLARALAIAWATLPSLADAARAVRFAQRLLGERGGVRMLAPLLQRSLERAGAVAAALELRGFAGRGFDGECLAPVEARDVEVGFDAGRASDDGLSRGIRLASLDLRAGTLALVTGPTGSGKTTLLRAIAGLHTHTDGGWLAGSLRVVGHDRVAVAPRDLARRIGVVLQHPREAFATERVRDEIGLALELRGVARVIVDARVAEVAARVGVTELLDRPTRGLSAGEATLVAIAAAVIEEPILLLVDEPLADLDAEARTRVAALLGALAHEAGVCVVVAEHRAAALEPIAEVRLRLEDGWVREEDAACRRHPVIPSTAAPLVPPQARPHERTRAAHAEMRSCGLAEDAPRVLRATGVTVRHGDRVAVAGVDLELRAGELVALVGPNGAGKSSLLAALALPARDTRVEASGAVALVPDASDDLFVADTVAAECARADRRATRGTGRGDGAPTAARFAGFLGIDADGPELAALLPRHPRDLSAGERRCLALAIQLSAAPRVLLFDEPTRGLDPAARDLVRAALVSLTRGGAAVLVASHEPDMAALADRTLSMSGGALGALGALRSQEEFPHRVPDPPPTTPFRTQDEPARDAPGARNHAAREHTDRSHPEFGTTGSRSRRAGTVSLVALLAANLVALAAFCWPLAASAVPEQAQAAVPVAALALAPLAALVVAATLDGTVRSAHTLAFLGTLAAIGAAVRIASTGVGGVEALFILLILAGRAFGARFGLLLGMASIALSTVVTGTFGPWTPFQLFACGWVGAVAGLLPRRIAGRPIGPRAEVVMLCVYGVAASYLFGLMMNLWFWPFAVGFGTGISYDGGAPIGVNLASFLLYSLVTSTLSWDTLRAITTVVGIVVIGRPVLAALRRTKPLETTAQGRHPRGPRRFRNDRQSSSTLQLRN